MRPKPIATLSALFVLLLASAAAAEPTSAEFLARARRQADAASYAMLDGVIQHRKDGGEMIELPVYLGVLITPAGTRAQFIIDGKEGYDIRQVRSGDGKAATVVVPQREGGYPAGRAAEFKLDPADLTTGFLFYDFLQEEEPARVKALPCRVMLLKNPKRDEVVRVYLTREHHFPLKAEFFNRGKTGGKPDKTLETASFKKQHELYYAELINLHGPGWRTRVQFTSAQVGRPETGRALPIFKELPKEK